MIAATVTHPNLYQLQGHHLHVLYAASGIDGQPHFDYQDAHQTLHFKGEEIRTVELEIGTLVTVTTRLTVDSGSTSFSVLLPRVNLDQTQQAHITTEGITTLTRLSLVPQFNKGQTQLYTVTRLTGTAQLVAF